MAAKKTCAATITNPRYPDVGRGCKRWAVAGQDFCAVHGGSNKNLLSDPNTLENRCTAKAHKTGAQCRNNSIPGGTVCRYHGGAAAHVQKSGRMRLLEMVEPALVELSKIITKPTTSDSDRLRAIQMTLDRTGYTPGMHVEVEVKPWQNTMQRIVKELPAEIAATLPPDDPAIIDAEVVEDDHEAEPPMFSNVTPIAPRIGSADPPRSR